MYNVILMDRDQTVDVNFGEIVEPRIPEDAEPVPLQWVIWMAHEAENTHVWATGNQHLKKEAQIPGIKESKWLWEGEFHHSVKKDYPDRGYHSYKPARQDRWRIIQDFYEEKFPDEDINYIVVDDTHPYRDQMESEGFDLYLPWDFRDEVVRGEAPITIPNGLDVPSEPIQSNEEYETEDNLEDLYMLEIRDG